VNTAEIEREAVAVDGFSSAVGLVGFALIKGRLISKMLGC